MDSEFTYYAFISYSHSDEEFAERLQDYLEHYRMPSALCRKIAHVPRHLHPIFRDATDLAIDSLREALTEALAASRYLVVLCSESSAKPNSEGKNWVNEEIKTFISLRPENRQRVIPLILRRDAGQDVADCLPPAIIEHRFPEAEDFAGADGVAYTDVLLRGEELVFNEAIARMAGISAQTLWARYQAWLKARRLRRRCAAGAGALAAAAGAWWCWDYYVPHERYYTDYVLRDNMPEGLFELTEEQAAARGNYYRFTTRMRLLRKVEHCNAKGGPTDHADAWYRHRPASMELAYSTTPDGRTSLSESIHRNAKGDIAATLKFSSGNIDLRYPRARDGHAGNPNRVGRHSVERQQGIITQELYRRYRSAVLMRDDRGVSGQGYELDEKGRPVAVRFLAVKDATATPVETYATQTAGGIAGYRLEYRDDGQVARVTYVDEGGRPALNGEQWAEARPQYDAAGQRVSCEFYDAQGQPITR